MLKFYKPTTTIYINEFKPFRISLYEYKISETPPNVGIIKINWDNVMDKLYNDLICIYVPFDVYRERKGLKLCFDDSFKNIKQWKEDLNIEIKTTWKEYNPSIKEVIKFQDGNKAIQYLVERGLNISNLK